MAEINAWTVGLYTLMLIMLQMMSVTVAAKIRFDFWSMLFAYSLSSFFYVLTMLFWMGIAAQLTGGL